MIAFGVALGFIVPAMGGNYLFARLSLKRFAIDAGYWVVIYTVKGLGLALIGM